LVANDKLILHLMLIVLRPPIATELDNIIDVIRNITIGIQPFDTAGCEAFRL
jgi:hypothetical protein